MTSVYYASGSYGNVYKCGNYITKTVPIQYVDTLFNEIAILRMINSKYIPKLISSSVNEKSGEITIPYYGVTLSEYIRNTELTIDCKHKLISQLLMAICDIHSLEVIHCDIKPNNIVVDENGKLTIIDFGISRSNIDVVYDLPIKFPLDGYGSPETYLGYKSLSKASDMWSVGCVIYYILNGKHMFSTTNYISSVTNKFGTPNYFKNKHRIIYTTANREEFNIEEKLKPFFEFDTEKRINCYDAYKLWSRQNYIIAHTKQYANLHILSVGSFLINDLLRAMSNVSFDNSNILSCVNIILQLSDPVDYIYPILYVVGMLYNGMDKESIIAESGLKEIEFYNRLLYIITNCNLNIV